MNPSFNLISEKWIPCIRPDGTSCELSLRDTLAGAHELREILDYSPLVTASVYRLLLTVLHRIFGPDNERQWVALWERQRFDDSSLDDYWTEWTHRFDLYHPQWPFYQVANFATRKQSPIARLGLEFSCGHNDTLFDHSVDESPLHIPHAIAARLLLAIQSYGLTGKLEGGYPKAGFLVDHAVSMLCGDSLWSTLMLNLIWNRPTVNKSQDMPTWEKNTPTKFAERSPDGYLDYLTWQARSIRLVPASVNEIGPKFIWIAGGYKTPEDASLFEDPQGAYRRDEERGLVPYRLASSKAVWRDSAALFGAQDDGKRPEAMNMVARLRLRGPLRSLPEPSLHVLGLATNRAKINLWRHERMPLPLDYLDNEALLGNLQETLRLAEDVASSLSRALWRLAHDLLVPEASKEGGRAPDKNAVQSLVASFPSRRQYWAILEIPFYETFMLLPDDQDSAVAAWRDALRDTARGALWLTTGGLDGSPRSLRAAAAAERSLNYHLKRTLNSGRKEVNTHA